MNKFDYRNYLINKGITVFPDKFYNSNRVFYHTLEHAENVIQEIYEYYIVYSHPDLSPEKDSNSYFTSHILAALWHDAVYVVGYPEGMNENLSADALLDSILSLELTFPLVSDIERANRFIRRTKISNHMSSEQDHAGVDILLDADLSSLGKDWDTFLDNNYKILMEHISDFDLDKEGITSLKPQAEFLKKLMNSRKTIYRTQYFIDKYEYQAKMNINKLCRITGAV